MGNIVHIEKKDIANSLGRAGQSNLSSIGYSSAGEEGKRTMVDSIKNTSFKHRSPDNIKV